METVVERWEQHTQVSLATFTFYPTDHIRIEDIKNNINRTSMRRPKKRGFFEKKYNINRNVYFRDLPTSVDFVNEYI